MTEDNNTERFDHVAEAIGLRQLAAEPQTPESAHTLVAAAQVHATLALVEQQRIANLIAAVTLNFGEADFTKPWDDEGDTQEWRSIRDEITAGLGIDVVSS